MGSVLRLATPADAAGIHAIYAPIVRDTVISFEFDPPTVEEIARRVANTLVQWPWLVCEGDGEVIGYAYAGRHRERAAYQWSVDVSVYILERARRSGVGRALYSALLPMVTLQGFYNAYAGITLPNAASVALHEAVGFTPLGVYHAVGYKFDAWHDVGWWERPLQPRRLDPSPPVPVDAVRHTAEWGAALQAGLTWLRRASPAR
jgi:phosphinothricin acetyltransferase